MKVVWITIRRIGQTSIFTAKIYREGRKTTVDECSREGAERALAGVMAGACMEDWTIADRRVDDNGMVTASLVRPKKKA